MSYATTFFLVFADCILTMLHCVTRDGMMVINYEQAMKGKDRAVGTSSY